MPFYLRHVSPLRVSDGRLPFDVEDECEATANLTLTAVLKQLSSLVLLAEDIFDELHGSFVAISDRTQVLRNRVTAVCEKVEEYKNANIPIPESELCTLSQQPVRFNSSDAPPDRSLFTADTRPGVIRRLYRHAVLSPVTVLRQLDAFRNDGLRSSKFFTCTPTCQPTAGRAAPALDIETRRPEAFDRLPSWTADEEQLTSPVHPDTRFNSHGHPVPEGTAHKLPSPDQVTRERSARFPAQIVPVDVTGHGFERQLQFRRSLVQFDYVKRRRKRRAKQRRNTISDSSDLRAALWRPDRASTAGPAVGRCGRRVCTDDRQTQTDERPRPLAAATTTTVQHRPTSPLVSMADIKLPMADSSAPLGRLVKLSSPDSPGYAATSLPSGHCWPGGRPLRRRVVAAPAPAASEASSSGRGSSGGSNRTSADSEPRLVSPADSGTAVSPADEPAESPQRRLASPADSGLSDGGRAEESFTSDDTVTPEYADGECDGDASSVFSCDAEGYYTSFHIDSGLRAAAPPAPPLRPDSRSSTVSASSAASSPRRRPPPPPRASSLDSANRDGAATAVPAPGRTGSPGGGSVLSGSEADGGEQFRSKTALTSGRIPSLCVITPPASEDGEAAPRDQLDRDRTPRPEDGVGSGWIGDAAPAGSDRRADTAAARSNGSCHRPPAALAKAPWGAPLSDWGSSETGESSGEAQTPPPVRPEAEGEEHIAVDRAQEAPSKQPSSLAQTDTDSWCSSSRSLVSSRGISHQMSALTMSPQPGARYGSHQDLPVYDTPLPVHPSSVHYQQSAAVRHYPLPGRPSCHSAPASPLSGARGPPRALLPSYPDAAATAERHPSDAGVRCGDLRRASVAGAPQSSPPWSDAATLERRVSESPALPRAGSLDRRAVRRYTVAAAARLYSRLRGKATSAAAPGAPATKPPARAAGGDVTGTTVSGQQHPTYRSSAADYGPAGPPQTGPPFLQRSVSSPQQTAHRQRPLYSAPVIDTRQTVYQRPSGQSAGVPAQPMYRHPSPMPQQRRPQETRLTTQQYIHQQQLLQQQLQQQQQRYHHQQQQQPYSPLTVSPRRQQQQRSPQVSPRGLEPWQTEGHYQSPRLWPRQTWVESPQPHSPLSPRLDDADARLSPRQQTPAERQPLTRPLPAHSRRAESPRQHQAAGGRPTLAPGVATSPRAERQQRQYSSQQELSAAAVRQTTPAPASTAASSVQQSPKPKTRSPFSFGRYSLRLRGPETSVPEPRRSAEAEQLLRSPTRLGQTVSGQPARAEPAQQLRTDEQKHKRLKKRWFFTLPGKSKRDKKKTKADDSSDDDGGFAAAGVSGVGGAGGSSFVRYESPDSVSSGVSSRASTPLTDASMSSSYFEMEQYFPSLNTSQVSSVAPRPLSSLSDDSARGDRCQPSPQLRAPRPPNFSDLEYSPPETVTAAAAAAAAAEWRRLGPGAPRLPGPMSRPADRLGPLPPPPPPAGLPPQPPAAGQRGWNNHPPPPPPAPGGSQIYGSPTAFCRPRPPQAPQPRRAWPPAATPRLSEPGQRASWAGGGSSSPRSAPAGQRTSWSGGPPTALSPARAQLTRPTPLNDFKELIARQGRSPGGGGPGRGSAAERLRAAAAAASPVPAPAPQSPLDARNSARAVLFQSRFGGRRGRPPGTSVIATTIPETEDELSEEPLPPARRQLFPAACDGCSSSSGSSSEQAATPRMSPSSPPPPYSQAASGRVIPSGLAAERHFTPVVEPAAGFRRSYSLPRHAGSGLQRRAPSAGDDQRPPIGSISRYQYRNRPCAALGPGGEAAAPSPFQRSRSLMSRLPSGTGRPIAPVARDVGGSQSPAAPRVETAI